MGAPHARKSPFYKGGFRGIILRWLWIGAPRHDGATCPGKVLGANLWGRSLILHPDRGHPKGWPTPVGIPMVGWGVAPTVVRSRICHDCFRSGATMKLCRYVVVISILLLPVLIPAACDDTDGGNASPSTVIYEPTCNIPIEELDNASAYWNTDWEGRSSELYDGILAVNRQYFQTHTYVRGETDCNDMVSEIWQILGNRGIVSLIAVGKLDVTGESFLECDHAWLLVYNAGGAAAALETTSGEIFTATDTQSDIEIKQYWEGFIYEKPSDLRQDFEKRW